MTTNKVTSSGYKGNIGNERNIQVYFYEAIENILSLPSTKWWSSIENSFSAGISNSIILTGNIYDYAIPGISFNDYLCSKMKEELGIEEVCRYNVFSINEIPISNDGSIDRFLKTFIAISNALKFNDKKRALILEYPQQFEDGRCGWWNELVFIESLKQLILNTDFKKSNNILIILSKSKDNLKKDLVDIDIPIKLIEVLKPNELERAQMIHYLYELNHNIEIKTELIKFAKITTGLNRNHLENIWNYSLRLGKLQENIILKYKNEIVNNQYGQFMKIYDATNKGINLDCFGGMEEVKRFVREDLINAIQKGDISTVSKGMLFMGPPGTGKTFFAKLLAQEAGVTFVELNLDSVHSKWVGESEANLRNTLDCIKSITPVIVFIDEIDQVLNRGNGDSNNVRGNIFHMMLTLMSDEEYRGKIIWIGATNYPERLDSALIRAGRFDNKFIFMPPTNIATRAEVFKSQLNMQGYPYKIDFSSEEFVGFMSDLQSYTQAEIQAIVMKSISLCKRGNEDFILLKHLRQATDYTRKSDNKQIEEMVKQAINCCNDLEFVPKELIEKYNLQYSNVRSGLDFD